MAALFVAFSLGVGLHLMSSADQATWNAFKALWRPSLQLPAQAVAELGGFELTALVGLGLFIFLWRRHYRWAAVALVTVPLANLLEAFYKRVGGHAGPPFLHPDGPSITDLLEGPAQLGSSYPSGHATRALLVYGLVAFLVIRLAPPGRLRRLAIPLAAVVIALVAVDRVYLGVHWESDVIGGLLLGGTMLAAAITWMDATAVRDTQA